MQVRELGDPRLQALFGTGEAKELGIRPVVRLPRSGPSGWMLALFALAAALLLFWVLDSRRTSTPEPSVGARAADTTRFAPETPVLYIPPASAPLPAVTAAPAGVSEPRPAAVPQPRAIASPAPAPQAYYPPEPMPAPLPQPPAPTARPANGPVLVVDTTAGGRQASAGDAAAEGAATGVLAPTKTARRARASALANRSTTVPQGTLVPAVLETAFESTRAGFARAIVSRDVRGFDGTRVLIPRGSRLVGEYQADVSAGQKRAMISWTRLLRPDGMMIAIDSPAVDPLGRGGVRASVNSHFFQRFADGLLQTAMNFGSMFATGRAGGSVVVMPGSTQNTQPLAGGGGRITPTLKVPAGTSISVFVAHDLDFGSGTGGQ